MAMRFASAADAAALLAIYGQYLDTSVTFEQDLPSEEEFARRIGEYGGTHPYLVWEEGGRPVGYAYAHRLGERAAYQWSAELSVYLDRDSRGRGLGRRLYGALLELLRFQGVRTVYGCVTVPNPASERLHEAMGFQRTGVWHRSGHKGGAWRDVTWFERPIAAYDPAPEPVLPIGAVPPAERAAVLARYSE